MSPVLRRVPSGIDIIKGSFASDTSRKTTENLRENDGTYAAYVFGTLAKDTRTVDTAHPRYAYLVRKYEAPNGALSVDIWKATGGKSPKTDDDMQPRGKGDKIGSIDCLKLQKMILARGNAEIQIVKAFEQSFDPPLPFLFSAKQLIEHSGGEQGENIPSTDKAMPPLPLNASEIIEHHKQQFATTSKREDEGPITDKTGEQLSAPVKGKYKLFPDT